MFVDDDLRQHHAARGSLSFPTPGPEILGVGSTSVSPHDLTIDNLDWDFNTPLDETPLLGSARTLSTVSTFVTPSTQFDTSPDFRLADESLLPNDGEAFGQAMFGDLPGVPDCYIPAQAQSDSAFPHQDQTQFSYANLESSLNSALEYQGHPPTLVNGLATLNDFNNQTAMPPPPAPLSAPMLRTQSSTSSAGVGPRKAPRKPRKHKDLQYDPDDPIGQKRNDNTLAARKSRARKEEHVRQLERQNAAYKELLRQHGIADPFGN